MSAILPRLVRRLLALLLCAGGLAAADPTLTPGQLLQVPLIGGSVVLNGTGLDQILANAGQQGITIGNVTGSASSTAAATSASATAITFTAPARAEGAYDISLPWSGGSLVASLAYRATPSFTNTPFSISYLGGTSCTLTGANLDLITALSVSPGGATAAITSQSRTVLTFVAPAAPAHAAGVVDLVVAWAAGANPGTITRPREITYYDSTPTVSSSGLRVSTQGGSVTIAGTNLNQVTAVRIGGMPATVTSQSATALTVTAPVHADATAVDVVFEYGSPVSTLTSAGLITYVVTPAITSTTVQFLATGGSFALDGSNLNLVTGVSIAGGTATITSQAPARLSITLGAHAAGSVDLVLTWTASGLSGSTAVPVSFRAVPVITADQKRTAKTDGSTTVTFTGSDLDLLTSLTVTGVSTASAVSTGSATQASILAPARAAGTVGATANYAAGGASGQSTASNLLVYAEGPVVTSGLALSASTVGSTSLVITGTGLDTVTGVMVGGTAVTMNTGLSATRLPITVPAMTAGAKAVVLTWMAVGASQPANHAAGSFITYVVPVDPPTPPFVTDGGGSGGCGLGGVGAVLAAGSLLLVRRRRT